MQRAIRLTLVLVAWAFLLGIASLVALSVLRHSYTGLVTAIGMISLIGLMALRDWMILRAIWRFIHHFAADIAFVTTLIVLLMWQPAEPELVRNVFNNILLLCFIALLIQLRRRLSLRWVLNVLANVVLLIVVALLSLLYLDRFVQGQPDAGVALFGLIAFTAIQLAPETHRKLVARLFAWSGLALLFIAVALDLSQQLRAIPPRLMAAIVYALGSLTFLLTIFVRFRTLDLALRRLSDWISSRTP
jgi:hypothetical protein